MPPPLEHALSEELLDCILSYCDQPTLAAVCRTCSTLSRIATPHLWSRICLTTTARHRGAVKYLLPLAYAVFSSPGKAAAVRYVAVPEGWGAPEAYEDDDTRRPWPVRGAELEGVLRGKCEEYAVDEEEAEELSAAVSEGYEEVVMALFVANLPCLRSLDVNFEMLDTQNNFSAMLRSVGKAIKPFDRAPAATLATGPSRQVSSFTTPLTVMTREGYKRDPNQPGNLACFFHLPNLDRIYAWMMGDNEEIYAHGSPLYMDLAPRSCPVQSIELRCSRLRDRNLKLLINATVPGRLTSFSYEIGPTWARWCTVDHHAIVASLSAHFETLKHLCLSHEDDYPYKLGYDADKPVAVSFTQFHRLQRLKIAPVYVWGHEGVVVANEFRQSGAKDVLWRALPRSLQQLWVTRAMQPFPSPAWAVDVNFVPDCLLPALHCVVERKREMFPDLTSLRIEFSIREWKEEWLDMLAAFCEKAAANDIACTVICANDKGRYHGHRVERNWGWDEDVEWDSCIHNQERPKRWIDVGTEQNLVETLRATKKQIEENN
ncbi:hypothetical protein ACN47E_008988 [Coniothyrium glycines]